MSTSPQTEDLARIIAYVDGELSGDERERFEDELSENELLRGELESFLRLDVLERHFHASSAKVAPALSAPAVTRPRIHRWLPLAAAAAVLLVVVWTQFGPGTDGPLQIRIASNAEDVFDTNRAPDPASPLLHIGFTATSPGFVRIFGQDDQGRWYSLQTGVLEKERKVPLGPIRFGGFQRTWLDEEEEERTYRAFVVMFSETSLASDRVTAALSELENATAEDVRQALEEAFDVRTGSVAVD